MADFAYLNYDQRKSDGDAIIFAGNTVEGEGIAVLIDKGTRKVIAVQVDNAYIQASEEPLSPNSLGDPNRDSQWELNDGEDRLGTLFVGMRRNRNNVKDPREWSVTHYGPRGTATPEAKTAVGKLLANFKRQVDGNADPQPPHDPRDEQQAEFNDGLPF